MSDRAAPLVTFTVLNEAPAQKNGGSLQHFPQIKGESNKKEENPQSDTKKLRGSGARKK